MLLIKAINSMPKTTMLAAGAIKKPARMMLANAAKPNAMQHKNSIKFFIIQSSYLSL